MFIFATARALKRSGLGSGIPIKLFSGYAFPLKVLVEAEIVMCIVCTAVYHNGAGVSHLAKRFCGLHSCLHLTSCQATLLFIYLYLAKAKNFPAVSEKSNVMYLVYKPYITRMHSYHRVLQMMHLVILLIQENMPNDR